MNETPEVDVGHVLVFGHRNPDNDSICSAVAYAALKNVIESRAHVPVRLGPMPPETAWTFERFGVPAPAEIEHVRPRVRDVMTIAPDAIGVDDTMLAAGRRMRERGIRALPVVDDGVVRGLVNVSILADRYIDETELCDFGGRPARVAQLVLALDGRLLAGDPDTVLSGGVRIAAMEPGTVIRKIRPGDTLIVGDRARTQPMAIEAGVACLVITGGFIPPNEVVELAKTKSAAIIVTDNDSYAAARLINLAQAVRDVMDCEPLLVDPDALLSEVTEDLFASPHREAIVVDDDGKLLGIVTRTNIARGARRQVVLVDHNERSQSAPGIEDAEVLEIVDHHRVGDVQTAAPIMFLNLPVGATATIVATRYRQLGVEVPQPIAGLLLSAVLSDTVLLKSPTTTELDREIVGWLAERAGVDAEAFGLEMFRARSAGQEFSAERAVCADLKEYHIGDEVVAIGQVETVDLDDVLAHRGELLAYAESLLAARRYDLVLLMVTDVVREGSELIAVGKKRLAERAFGASFADDSVWLPGVLSRKKQVAARLVAVTGR